jgi:hypothetical protein
MSEVLYSRETKTLSKLVEENETLLPTEGITISCGIHQKS